MKKQFIRRIMNERIVDTRNYRYTVSFDEVGAMIWRLPISYLDTTAALTEWRMVKEINI